MLTGPARLLDSSTVPGQEQFDRFHQTQVCSPLHQRAGPTHQGRPLIMETGPSPAQHSVSSTTGTSKDRRFTTCPHREHWNERRHLQTACHRRRLTTTTEEVLTCRCHHMLVHLALVHRTQAHHTQVQHQLPSLRRPRIAIPTMPMPTTTQPDISHSLQDQSTRLTKHHFPREATTLRIRILSDLET